jgi:hypothetical protein
MTCGTHVWSMSSQQMPRYQDLILRRGCGAALAACASATVPPHVSSSTVPSGVPAAPRDPTAAVLLPLVIPLIKQYHLTVVNVPRALRCGRELCYLTTVEPTKVS